MMIETLTQGEREKLQVEIDKCLQVLYKLEKITRYEEKAIGNCIDFLQHLELVGVCEEVE